MTTHVYFDMNKTSQITDTNKHIPNQFMHLFVVLLSPFLNLYSYVHSTYKVIFIQLCIKLQSNW